MPSGQSQRFSIHGEVLRVAAGGERRSRIGFHGRDEDINEMHVAGVAHPKSIRGKLRAEIG